jgi:4-amino-4-deoxy-L-arabinose transferase-like glycosyltransferase
MMMAKRRRLVFICVVFLVAFGVRLLCWHDTRIEAAEVQSRVTLNYKSQARLLVENGFSSLFDPHSPTNNPDLLGHPPGYPIILALINRVAGESDTAIQVFQTICDSVAAVMVLLIAAELFPFAVAVIAGLMAALSPQFSWNSLLLLPDTLAVVPILFAVYLVVRSIKNPRLIAMLGAGVLIGLSCWLRANGLLLAPFLLLMIPLVFGRKQRLRPALTLLGGAILVIAPLTIRNAVVFGHFIPVSLGAGQTLIEGIADYDADKRFDLPDTDMELIRGEAEASRRPEYASSLFTPDGIERDRARLGRGAAVIRAHPLWFFGVMVRRAGSMLRLERTPLLLTTNISNGVLRYPRFVIFGVQRLFITALVLPLTLLGAILLIVRQQTRGFAILLVVPAYYFCTQSALHTEYRYVLAIPCFLFILSAIALHKTAEALRRKWVRTKAA